MGQGYLCSLRDALLGEQRYLCSLKDALLMEQGYLCAPRGDPGAAGVFLLTEGYPRGAGMPLLVCGSRRRDCPTSQQQRAHRPLSSRLSRHIRGSSKNTAVIKLL